MSLVFIAFSLKRHIILDRYLITEALCSITLLLIVLLFRPRDLLRTTRDYIHNVLYEQYKTLRPITRIAR